MSDERPREDEAPGAPGAAEAGVQEAPRARVTFSPRRLRWELWRDAALRVAAVVGLVGLAAAAIAYEGQTGALSSVAVLLAIVAWLGLNATSSRVSRELPRIGALMGVDPAAAEAALAEALRRRPLLSPVRLMLYHRLAVLRHREGRFEESAAIAAAVLGRRMGPARQVRPHLLLMLAEANLQLGHTEAAYPPLHELYNLRLGLAEALQRLALQTRYEVLAGHHAAAIGDAERKIEMAELMPAPQCGAMHAMLATAAHATGRGELGQWLWDRAELLLSPGQLQQVVAGQFGVTVAEMGEG